MAKGRDRGPRRRGFDDDDYLGPPPEAKRWQVPRRDGAPSASAIEGTVKWFNAEKGCGFVELADGSGDVFLHIAALERAGHESIAPGAKLSVQVGVGQKGRQITAVLAVDASAAAAPRPKRQYSPASPSGRERPGS